MNNKYDRYRHEHDKGILTKLYWLKQLPKFWRSPLNKEVVKLANPRQGERALDIGAGMGPAAVDAAKRGAHVVAVDPSRFMRQILGFRRQFQKDPGLITVEAGAAEKIPLASSSTDVIWAVNAVHHWVDIDSAIDEITRVIAPGGRVILVDEDFTDPSHPKHSTHHDHEEELTNVDIGAIKDSFEAKGFEAFGEKTLLAEVPVKLIRATRTLN